MANASGHSPEMADAILAGTSAVHNLVVVTNNGKHFADFNGPFQSPQTIGKIT
jgi:predicted nucleic acid-binding protein